MLFGLVSKDTLVKHLEKELLEAKRQLNHRENFLRSIAKMKLLCELLLDESEEKDITTDEEKISEMVEKLTEYDDDDLNKHATSLLDF